MKNSYHLKLSQLLGFMLLLILGGCASAPKTDYDINYNFNNLTTYQFLTENEQPDPLVSAQIKSAIEHVLNTQGYQLNLTSNNFNVSYRLISSEKPKSSGLSIGLGTGTSGRNSSIGIGTSVGVPIGNNTVTEQKIQIDIIDAKTNKLVWHGEDKLKLSKGGEANVAATTKTVTHILAAFPPKK